MEVSNEIVLVAPGEPGPQATPESAVQLWNDGKRAGKIRFIYPEEPPKDLVTAELSDQDLESVAVVGASARAPPRRVVAADETTPLTTVYGPASSCPMGERRGTRIGPLVVVPSSRDDTLARGNNADEAPI
jgi:hypothetical protein